MTWVRSSDGHGEGKAKKLKAKLEQISYKRLVKQCTWKQQREVRNRDHLRKDDRTCTIPFK